ncbi:hypothetical protein [Niallia taxi]|uniref:hypothetical protein n=1 Tax=Niallia taxi TaxID=2499688 RepID=UPI0015F6BE07|nr:hypothetical protein [Niallia taxi]
MKNNWYVLKVKTVDGFRILVSDNNSGLEGVALAKNLTEDEAFEFGKKISKETGVPMAEKESSV